MQEKRFDALIVGAGFGGIYQLYTLLKLGLSAKVIDNASDVGGTWYWNRYPGAMSDTESFVYRYSWDQDDLQNYPWTHHYVKQPQVLQYLEHVVHKYDLRKYMQFKTELLSAEWDDSSKTWHIAVSTGEVFVVKYLVTALGLLSKQNFPDIPGMDNFRGDKVHTAAWRPDIIIKDKKVGVIGCGSTGVQVITEIAKDVETLTCFQRTPQYTVPSGDRHVTPEYREWVNENYESIWDLTKNSSTAFAFVESTTPCLSVSDEERERTFERLWHEGNGFKFYFGGFSDIATNPEANEEACKFIRKKISQIVKDPVKAQKLTPYDYHARRPLCDGGYFEQFNRENVSIVDLKETPITEIVPEGIKTSDGSVHELDIIIFATGFDAVDGNYTRVRIRGRDGISLKDHWHSGPTSYLGVAVSGFPNLFMITGPQGPFCNIPPAIEANVEFITKAIERAERDRNETEGGVIEALPEAEESWGKTCEELVEGSLFKKTSSWIFGCNVPGKTFATRFYFGGLGKYRQAVQNVMDDGYRGFKPLAAH